MNNNGTDASLVGFAATIFFTSLAAFYKKKNATAQDEKKKEQSAKASFRVRKSNLMSIAGRGVQRKKKQKQQMNRDQLITGGHAAATWHERLMSSCIVQVMAHVLSIISFGYLQLLSDINTSNATQEKQSKKSRKHNKRTNLEEYYDNIAVVGLDCEMVGGGRNGMKSLLARCSVVTLDHIPTHHDIGNNKSSPQKSQKKNITSLNQNLVVLYDKYIIPREKITDNRTEW